MREIKFRGLRTDSKGWVYGSLVNNGFFNSETKQSVPYIFNTEECDNAYGWEDFDDDYGYYQVIPESVGQYTGIKDKNGKDIYEGDKFSPDIDIEECMAVVRWCDKFSKYVVDSYGYNFHIGEGSQEVYDNEMSICDTIDLGDISSEYLEIIGNIHETP